METTLFQILIVICFYSSPSQCDDNEYRLTQYLMANYDSSVRPVRFHRDPLNVTFGLSLHHIIDVDERNQVLTTNCWLTQTWTDHHLEWNSSDFDGIQIIRLPFHRVWKPDIILYNNADPQFSSAVINTNVILTSDGQVTWLSHGIYSSSCDMDVEFFPFDIQNCRMKWASWTYDGYTLDMIPMGDDGDLSNYQSNGEFDLTSFKAIKNVEVYSCCPEPYPDITFVIQLRRRPMFYVFNLILPCMLINGIALLVFYVPSESGEKVTLGISAVLSMTVFLMTIRESLPPTEKTPLISLYYGVTISLVSFASGLSVLTLNLYHRGTRGVEVPAIIKTVVLRFLSRLVLVNNTVEPDVDKKDRLRSRSIPIHEEIPRLLNSPSLGDMRPHRSNVAVGDIKRMSPILCSDELEMRVIGTLEKVLQAVDRTEQRLRQHDQQEITKHEWQQVAMVCDRFLLLLFLLATAAATSAILLSSPHGP